MKKIFLVFIAILAIFAGCSSNLDVESNTQVPAETQNSVQVDASIDSKDAASEIDVDVVESQATISNEDVEITTTVDSQGNVKNDVAISEGAIEGDLEIAAQSSINDWCVAGDTYKFEGEGASIDVVYEGIADYNGVTTCKGVHTQTMEYIGEINTEYYLSEDMTEIWIVSNIAGNTQESYVKLG